MGRQRTEEPMLDTDPRRKPGKKLLDATMFVKWAIIKLLITMHLAMPADIFTKAVDLETHTKMRNLMMNISWVYKGNTAKMTRLVKALTDTLSRMA